MHKVLGEGAYGCVHKPSLQCSDKEISYKNKVSKVMLSKHAVAELREYTMISQADKKREYFMGVPVRCSVKNNAETRKALSKCGSFKKELSKTKAARDGKELKLLIMKDGGKNLKQFAKKFSEKGNAEILPAFWLEMHRLFRGLRLFQQNGILHHDIKPHNIVYNEQTNRVNFIDFGHMRQIPATIEKSKKSDNWIYDYPFWNYPLEIEFLNRVNFMAFAKLSTNERKQYIMKMIREYNANEDTKFDKAFSTFMDYMTKNRSHRKEIFKIYFNSYQSMLLSQIRVDKYDSFLHKSIETIDTYGLGMTLQYVISYMKQLMIPDMVVRLESLFFLMTTPDVSQRYTIDQAIAEYEDILRSVGYLV
jgi:serine/threonine protein kinase